MVHPVVWSEFGSVEELEPSVLTEAVVVAVGVTGFRDVVERTSNVVSTVGDVVVDSSVSLNSVLFENEIVVVTVSVGADILMALIFKTASILSKFLFAFSHSEQPRTFN